ncbi:MAG: phosphatase PAP2 family protein [Vulcanimicrobiota bacterium]
MIEDLAKLLGGHPFETALLMTLMLLLVIFSAYRLLTSIWPRLESWQAPKVLQPVLKRLLTASGLALLGLFLASSAFLHLADWVTEGEWVDDWDLAFVHAAHHQASPFEVHFFRVVTFLAGREMSYLLGFGVGLFFLFTKHKRALTLWVVGLLGNGLLVQVLKMIYQRERPQFDQPLLTESNFSFPSGHAAASILIYGLLAYLLRSRLRERWMALSTVLVSVGCFVGTSRLVLGVHYPSDVAAGWATGMAWLATLVMIDQWSASRARRDSAPHP